MLYKLCEADITSYLINIFAIYLPITAKWLYNEKAIKKKKPCPKLFSGYYSIIFSKFTYRFYFTFFSFMNKCL